jgi:putative CocE/NonD family hydrolase
MRALAMLLVFPLAAGCLGGAAPQVQPRADDPIPFMGYEVPAPDMALRLLETAFHVAGVGVDLHARVVRPEGPGPFPVVVQFTPYTAPGRNVPVSGAVEPLLEPTPLAGTEHRFVTEFVRRGYAFVYADVRGTGDSTGCLDLRGKMDVADLYRLTEHFGTVPWSNGKVGFIGASYPGSEAHMAGLADNPHLAAIVPVVASTSFYHYHHNDGIPYRGQHSLGGTNTGYTQNALAATHNPHYANYLTRYAEEASCPHKENIVDYGGWDQSGTYDAWWAERNLRPHAATIRVPVLMAQGLADWNVKPDHIAHWFNDLTAPKTLIAGQWGHQYPASVCRGEPSPTCDPHVPYGEWWAYVTAFFDTHLKGIDTGMFDSNVAWVQDNSYAWHRSANWPLLPTEREVLRLHLRPDGGLGEASAEAARASWYGCPNDRWNRGTQLAAVEAHTVTCKDRPDQEIVFESAPLEQDLLISGVPLLYLRVQSEAPVTHLVTVLQVVDGTGAVVAARENYGYLNPTYREGLENPQPLPTTAYNVTIDFYPQEDLVRAGQKLRLIVRSDDQGRTIEAYEPGANAIAFGPDAANVLELPLRPAAKTGLRLG